MMRFPRLFGRHVTLQDLLRLADGAAPNAERLRAHLAACTDCRLELQRLRALRTAAEEMDGPLPSEDLLARIHQRVAAGEAVLLPVTAETPAADRRPQSRGLTRLATVAAAALVIVIGSVFMWPDTNVEAGALSGELSLAPSAPRPGDSVEVAFRAAPLMAGEERLVLRGRYRTIWDAPYNHGTHQQRVAILHRGPDGVYRGSFRLPDDVVYATFAVEDTTAARIDSRGRRLWELVVADSAGRPLPDALQQREFDLMGRNMALAFETARQRAAAAPDLPGGWANLYFHETVNLGPEADTALGTHRARLARLHELWASRRDPPFEVVDGMLSYAAQVTDQQDSLGAAVRAHWRPLRERAVAVDRADRVGVEARWHAINLLAVKDADSARVALVLAERFWTNGGSRDPRGANLGAQIARLASDTGEARVRWMDRAAMAMPARAEGVYRTHAQVPALRRTAAQRLDELARRLLVRDDARRPLESSVAEALHADSIRARETLAYLAETQLALGDTVSARATYEAAVAGGWNRVLFHRAASLAWALGDTTDAVRLFARMVVDPATPPTDADSLTRRATDVVADTTWSQLVDGARARMRDHFMATAVRGSLPADIPLEVAGGEVTSLAQIAGDRIAVVVFWSRHCGASRAQMGVLDSLSHRLARQGAVLIPITDEPLTEPVTTFLREQKVTVPVYVDRTGAARRAFDQWATPEYYVLDETGKVRFRESTLQQLPAQVAALDHPALEAAGR